MLWSEKVHFVYEVVKKKYFDTDYYGWCDIGYFRNRKLLDMSLRFLVNWPNNNKINKLNKDKIHYGLLNNNRTFLNDMYNKINNKNKDNLPIIQTNPNIVCFSGGFFILHHKKAKFWKKLFRLLLEQVMKYLKYTKIILLFHTRMMVLQ